MDKIMWDKILLIFRGENICREAMCEVDIGLVRVNVFDIDSDEDVSRVYFDFVKRSLNEELKIKTSEMNFNPNFTL